MIIDHWIDAKIFTVIISTLVLCNFLMIHKKSWSHSIIIHSALFAAMCVLLFTLNRALQKLLADHNITAIKPNTIDDLTIVAVALIAMQQAFILIDRLSAEQIKRGSDKTSANSISRILKLAIVAILVLLFGERLGLSFSSLLAFGGFGGIALGIAGKDVLSNVFSGVMLYFDRPFKLGDWIKSSDRDIEGIVEEVGWRMTRITTFDNRPLYVPNSFFSSISVENPGQMTNRRISTTIGLRYQDAREISVVVSDIRNMLMENEDIDSSQSLLVFFDAFGESSLNIMVYCFTKTTNWSEWLQIQQNVYLKIVDIVHTHGADFAFPSQSIYIEGS